MLSLHCTCLLENTTQVTQSNIFKQPWHLSQLSQVLQSYYRNYSEFWYIITMSNMSGYSGVPRILQMCMHSLFCVCIGGGGQNFPPTPQRKKAREVYAPCFVHTSSYYVTMSSYYVTRLTLTVWSTWEWVFEWSSQLFHETSSQSGHSVSWMPCLRTGELRGFLDALKVTFLALPTCRHLLSPPFRIEVLQLVTSGDDKSGQ